MRGGAWGGDKFFQEFWKRPSPEVRREAPRSSRRHGREGGHPRQASARDIIAIGPTRFNVLIPSQYMSPSKLVVGGRLLRAAARNPTGAAMTLIWEWSSNEGGPLCGRSRLRRFRRSPTSCIAEKSRASPGSSPGSTRPTSSRIRGRAAAAREHRPAPPSGVGASTAILKRANRPAARRAVGSRKEC